MTGTSGEDRKVRRALRRRSRLPTILGLAGVAIVGALVFTAVFAPWLAPYDPTERVSRPFLPPSAQHLLGTNDVGHDLLSEIIFGSRVSLLVGLVAATVALLIGTTVGVVAGYYPKRLGSTLMRGVDVILILPFLPLLIVLAAYLGRSLLNTIPGHRGADLGGAGPDHPITGPIPPLARIRAGSPFDGRS